MPTLSEMEVVVGRRHFFKFLEAMVSPVICIPLVNITHHRLRKIDDSSRKPEREPSR